MRYRFRLIGLAVCLAALVQAEDAPKKISYDEALRAAASKVIPEYPVMARQLKITGSVELEALVAENGHVEKVTIVSGNPVLTRPAADALRGWKFKPFTDTGKPVRVIAPVKMKFDM